MLSALTKLLALVAALLAAAPPGACCWAGSAPSSSRQASCCAAKAAGHQQGPEQAPGKAQDPKAACCCQQPVTEQAKVSVERTDGLVVSLSAISSAAFSSIDLARANAAPLKDAGPPLHLLHCVWRC